MDKKKLQEKHLRLVEQSRSLLNKAEAESRNLNAEEQTSYDAMWKDINETQARMERIDKQEQTESALAKLIPPQTPGKEAKPEDKRTAEIKDEFRSFLKSGIVGPKMAEARALDASDPVAGGYLVPSEFINSIIKKMDDMVVLRGLASVITVTKSANLGQPTLETDPSDSDWTPELGTGDEDSAMNFGLREMKTNAIAKRIKVSNTLLRLVPSVEALVSERLGYKFAVTAEKAFMTGNGAGKPLGLFTASASGINTDRDIATGNSATAPTFDGLINVKYALKTGYLANARWLFHRDVLSVLAKIKDGNSQYIWQPSVVLGQPDRMLGLPMVMSEFAPNTLTANQYVGMLGDFKYYQIVDSLSMVMQRLVELYAEKNQTGFIGRMEFDGAPILGEAFARVKLGA